MVAENGEPQLFGPTAQAAWTLTSSSENVRENKDETIRHIDADALDNYKEFTKSLQFVLQRYEAAMREMVVRFDILDKDLSLRRNRNPIHHFESRIKTPASIYEKLLRYGKEPSIENLEEYLMDVAGVRVIVSYLNDVYSLMDLLRRQDDLEIVRIKDYIANPKPNGYRSLHAIVRIPVYFLDSKQMVPVEVQIRTIAMNYWASLEHDLKYKAIAEMKDVDVVDELKDCSRILEDVEHRMQILADVLDSSQPATS